jgi:hypothetical protein
MHVEVPQADVERDSHVLASFPRRYGECLRRGLGTSTPCPWARCRYSLLAEVSTRPRHVREIINLDDDSDEFFERPTCALAVAREGQVQPVRIAELLKVSLALEELDQRHALMKVGEALSRVRDEQRHVEMNVDGLPDGGKGSTAWPKKRHTKAAPFVGEPRSIGGAPFLEQIKASLERAQTSMQPWKRVSREEAAAMFGADRLHPEFGQPKPALVGWISDALPTAARLGAGGAEVAGGKSSTNAIPCLEGGTLDGDEGVQGMQAAGER